MHRVLVNAAFDMQCHDLIETVSNSLIAILKTLQSGWHLNSSCKAATATPGSDQHI